MVWVWSSALALCGGDVICICSLCGVGGVVMFPLWCRGCGHVCTIRM